MGRDRKANVVIFQCFFIGGRVLRQGRWESSEVGRQSGRLVSWEGGKGGRVVCWQGGKGGKVVMWQGGKGGRVVRQKGRRYLILFKDGEHKMSPRFLLFVSNVNQRNEGVEWVQDFLAWP